MCEDRSKNLVLLDARAKCRRHQLERLMEHVLSLPLDVLRWRDHYSASDDNQAIQRERREATLCWNQSAAFGSGQLNHMCGSLSPRLWPDTSIKPGTPDQVTEVLHFNLRRRY